MPRLEDAKRKRLIRHIGRHNETSVARMTGLNQNVGFWGSNTYYTTFPQPPRRIGIVDDSLTDLRAPALPDWHGSMITQQVIYDAMKSGKHDVAMDEMRKVFFSCSSTLAKRFGKRVDYPNLVGRLIQDLKDDGILDEDEWNRLTVLVMVLDGLDAEVNECGGKLDPDGVEYLWEYCRIAEQVIMRHHKSMVFDYMAGPEDASNQQASGVETPMNEYITVPDTRFATNAQEPL